MLGVLSGLSLVSIRPANGSLAVQSLELSVTESPPSFARCRGVSARMLMPTRTEPEAHIPPKPQRVDGSTSDKPAKSPAYALATAGDTQYKAMLSPER